jgi:enoyl-CoA hydratase
MEAVNEGADLPLEQGLATEIDAFVAICDSEDMREGTGAFLEKRKADFQGR